MIYYQYGEKNSPMFVNSRDEDHMPDSSESNYKWREGPAPVMWNDSVVAPRIMVEWTS